MPHCRQTIMYTMHVDFVLWYAPPMDDNGHGIRLNRAIELPFPPTEDISVFSKSWEGMEMEDPMGYHLKEITWDLDRQCFLAETRMSSTGVPIALIPYEIQNLLEQGHLEVIQIPTRPNAEDGPNKPNCQSFASANGTMMRS